VKVEVVLAPNPGLFTGPGTNTWLVTSEGESIVIDPGPTIPAHTKAILGSIAGTTPIAVLVTHAHPDHAPAANGLASTLGVPSVGFEEGPDFSPDRQIAEGETVEFGAASAVCVTTPGHTPDSVSYRVGDALFTGDHIMGGSTVVVADMTDYLNSLRRLHGTGLATIYPGHGPVIDAPDSVIAQYIDHRLEREGQIFGSIEAGAGTLGAVVLDVYSDVDPALHPAAAMSVAAHLTKLVSEGRIACEPAPLWDSVVVPA